MPDEARRGRLFLALPLSADARQQLAEHCRDLRSISWLRVSAADKHHVTLQFFGAMPPQRVAAAECMLATVAEEGVATALTFGGLAALPPRGAPRVIYARPTGPTIGVEQLIQSARAAALEQGFAVDRRPPLPHVTVARSRGSRGGRSTRQRLPGGALTAWATPVTAQVTAVTLYASHSRPGGAVYEELATRRLAAAS